MKEVERILVSVPSTPDKRQIYWATSCKYPNFTGRRGALQGEPWIGLLGSY